MRIGVFAAVALMLLAPVFGCHKGKQAVDGVARNAVNAEHKAQATAAEQDKERTELALIPVPTKSLYVDVHDPSQWQNPFLTVRVKTLDLRIVLPDDEISSYGDGTMLRPKGARRQELQLRYADLGKAIASIPPGAWHYGRVIAVAESPEAANQDRPAIRRKMETVIRELNDLGVVVEEWPSQ